MMQSISRRITTFFCNQKIISEEMRDVFQYGTEILISGLVGILNILIISFCIGELLKGLMFLMIFIPLRMYVGGYHADTYFICNILFIAVFLLTIYGSVLSVQYNLGGALWILAIVSFMCVGYIAPVQHAAKTISKGEKVKYRIIAIIIYSSLLIGNTLLSKTFVYLIEISIYINIVLITVAILAVIGIGKERIKYNEK